MSCNRTFHSFSLVSTVFCCLALFTGCEAPGDQFARIQAQAKESGCKLTDVAYVSSTTVTGTASGSAVPPSGNAGSTVASVTSFSFHIAPVKDPSVTAKFGLETTSPNADALVALAVGGNPVAMVNDAASAAALAKSNGGNWHVFAPAAPVVLDLVGHNYAVSVLYSRTDSMPLPPAGTPFPAKSTSRFAFQIMGGQWVVFPPNDPITADAVIISLTAPSSVTGTNYWRFKQGTALTVPRISIKNSVASPQNVTLQAQFTPSQPVVSQSMGAVSLGQYDLKTLQNVALHTQGLKQGVYLLKISAMSGAKVDGSTQIVAEVTP